MRKPPSVGTKSGSLELSFAGGFCTLGEDWVGLFSEDPGVLLLATACLGEGAVLAGELDPLSGCF